MKPCGIYGRHAADYIAAGLPCFPVDARAKRPAVRNWKSTTVRASRAWAHKFPDADGLGVLMGPLSRLTEVDVDMVGDAALGMALEYFGESPVTIRTASGKSKIWYRHDGEGRRIKPIPGLDVDILGSGFSIAPPSWRDDLGAGYRFLTGGLADLDRLPLIRSGARWGAQPVPEAVLAGTRNNTLWRWAMTHARFFDDVEALIDAALTWARAMPDPLTPDEVERAARSAWRYEVTGRNLVGRTRPSVTPDDLARERLKGEPGAFFMWHELKAFHSNRDNFAIAPEAWAPSLGMSWKAVARGRDVLLARGLIEEVVAPSRGKHRAGRYRLRSLIS